MPCKSIDCCNAQATGLGPAQSLMAGCSGMECCQTEPAGMGPAQEQGPSCRGMDCCGNDAVIDGYPVKLTVEMLGPVDDDLALFLNGAALTQPGLTYWDYVLNDWSDQWRRFIPAPGFAPPAPGTPEFFPITSSNRRWNVGWYAGASFQTSGFIRIQYTGLMDRGDQVDFFVFDGWQSNWAAAPWIATIVYSNGFIRVEEGGSTFNGTTPDVPSPPRINPAGPVPYQSMAQYAAANGMPSYFSQGYPGSGPFFEDLIPMGSFRL